MATAQRPGARVRVVDRSIERRRPGQRAPTQPRNVIDTQPARRPDFEGAFMPSLQVARTVCERGEGSDRIEEIQIVVRRAVEVFLGELQPKASREPASPVTIAVDDLRI